MSYNESDKILRRAFMSFITNFNDDFIRSIVASINSAVTDDIMQDTRHASMDRNVMNSYPSRIWDLINRNVCAAFTYFSDVIVEFTKRGPWNLLAIFDKSTGMLVTLMREERFYEVKRDSKNHKHYIYELANMFNADLEIQQQSMFEPDPNEEKIKESIKRICDDLLISTEMVQHHAIILFSSHDELMNSIRCCMINCNFEECETVSWNEYIGVSESVVVEQTTHDDNKSKNPTMGLDYTSKAKKKKQLNLDIATKSDIDIAEAK